ncbi:hypothetical protein QCA50_015564 [Cerrena zonata]|uniref:Uncharacterized protein n=1 Tax=Cerrena zonata TaxID=2478898 RepID=A0AAW0FMS9_9APHY
MDHGIRGEDLSDSKISLPSELLREIFITVFTDYLEDVMPNPAIIRNFSLAAPLPANTTLKQAMDIIEEEFQGYFPPMLGPYDCNHFVPLLQTSPRIRYIALSVLSDTLYIPFSEGRLSSRPWPLIRQIMGLYANPSCSFEDAKSIDNGSLILRSYSAIACSEWCVWLQNNVDIFVNDPPSEHIVKMEMTYILTVAALGNLQNRGIISRKLQHRAIISLPHCVFSLYMQSILQSLERTYDILHHPDIIQLEANNNIYTQMDSVLLVHLIKGYEIIYGPHGLVAVLPADLSDQFPPYVIAEIVKEFEFANLRPIVAKIATGQRRTPSYEKCRKFALMLLENEPRLPWASSLS